MRTRFPVGVHNYNLRHNIFFIYQDSFSLSIVGTKMCSLWLSQFCTFGIFHRLGSGTWLTGFEQLTRFWKEQMKCLQMLFPDRSLAETNLNEFLLRKQLKLIFWWYVDQSYHIIGFNSFTTNAASPQRNSYVITVK